MNKSLHLICLAVLFIFSNLLSITAFGQNNLNIPKNNIAATNRKFTQGEKEKIYLHLDRNWYKTGDTIWYKAYLLNESFSASLKSGLLYTELINDSNRVVKRQTIKIQNGIANGDIEVRPKFYPGTYILRAYTNWMRNFDQAYFFSCQISIAPSDDQYWLVNEHHAIDKDKNVSMTLHFNDLVPKNIGFRDMQLTMQDGKNVLWKNKALTDPYGNLSVKFKLPSKGNYKYLTMQAEDISPNGGKRKILIPFLLNSQQNTDLQFMPEGGELSVGLPARIGFKAIGEDGKGVAEIKGQVYDHTMKPVASFQSAHKGMGSFMFTPQAGETYTAKIIFADGSTKTCVFPAVKSSGIGVQFKNPPGKDSLEIHLTATNDILNRGNSYTLTALAKDKICYNEHINFGGKAVIKKIKKNIFPTGIVKFILVDNVDQPVCRRLIFIDNDDELNININSNKKKYHQRDSISLNVFVRDATGKPVKGNFSLAVTDDNQIKASDNDAQNIENYMLLSSDLKGTVEEPGYYFFDKKNKDRAEALDNLLLTQGWASYDWAALLSPLPKMQYKAETEFSVSGKITNIFNKPITNSAIEIDSDFPPFSFVTNTDKDGCFNYSDFPDMENIGLHIHAEREFNVGIYVDQFKPPGITVPLGHAIPWYINSDSTFVNYVTDKNWNKVTNEAVTPLSNKEQIKLGKRMLKEVIIRNNYLRHPPPVRLMLDEEDLRTARIGSKPINLLDLLDTKEKISHMFKDLIVDEMPFATRYDMPSSSTQWEINEWLKMYTTEDIQDITVERIFFYSKTGETPALRIYITSNARNGPDMNSNNEYDYRPMPISHPHKFYSPLYTIKKPAQEADKRATIYWAPDVVTDDSGKATVSFYSADLAGTYSIILQGSDMNGNVAYQKDQLNVIK